MSSSILILTTSKPQATSFVTRLLAHSNLPTPSTTDQDEAIPYSIDNKYYSAVVPIVIQQLEEADGFEQREDFPVLIWLLPEGEELTSRSIPSALKTHLSTSSSSLPDVALAIITPSSSSSTPLPTSLELPDSLLEAYDDLGMELIDEGALFLEEADEEDEDYSPPLPPLEQISQAIQTHLWPGLILKAQQPSHQPRPSSSSATPASTSTPIAFPESFSSSLDDSLPILAATTNETNNNNDDFGPLQSSSSSNDASDFTSEDFLAATSLSPQPSFGTQTQSQGGKQPAQRSFTDSFSPTIPPTTKPSQPPTEPSSSSSSFLPPPPNGELLSSFPTSLSTSNPFSTLDMGSFQRLVDSDDDDDDEKELNGMDAELSSTLMNLQGLREELRRVENEEERRELAGRLVEGLFGMGMGMEGEEEQEGEVM